MRALRKLRRDYPRDAYVFVSERGGPISPIGFHRLIQRVGETAKMPFPIHPHMLRHACGFKLANDGHDTRALQHYLPAHGQVHRNGARQVQRLLEGLTMAGPARGPGPLCGKLALSACRVELAHLVVAVTGAPHVTHAGEVTSRAITCAVGPSSSCAPAGQLRCQPPSSTGSACALWALTWPSAQPQGMARWEPVKRQAPPCLQ